LHVKSLALRGFRCFPSTEFEFDRGVNVIVGDNASGKTSLLEALFLLGRGVTFRSTRLRDLIHSEADRYNLRAVVRDQHDLARKVSIEGYRNRREFYLDTQSNVSRFDLVQCLPLQLIDPDVHRLLEEGPQYRRRFMDWGVFHVEHSFFSSWQRFRRALIQRNRALRLGWPNKDIVSWDPALVREARQVDSCRRGYVDDIARNLPTAIRKEFTGVPIHFDYRSGWPTNESLDQALARTLERDKKAGFTQIGPHRADLRITHGNVAARDKVSHGQQKLLTSGMLLAQARVMANRRGVTPVLLVDDIAAELGARYRALLGQELTSLQSQVFITFLDRAFIPNTLGYAREIELSVPSRGSPEISKKC